MADRDTSVFFGLHDVERRAATDSATNQTGRQPTTGNEREQPWQPHVAPSTPTRTAPTGNAPSADEPASVNTCALWSRAGAGSGP